MTTTHHTTTTLEFEVTAWDAVGPAVVDVHAPDHLTGDMGMMLVGTVTAADRCYTPTGGSSDPVRIDSFRDLDDLAVALSAVVTGQEA